MTTTTTARRYRWSDLEKDQPMAGVGRRRIIGEKAMISEVHLPPGVPHSADATSDSLVLDIFAPPSATTGVDAHG